ncbi:hypothetical protein UFOVP177_5 [uncultured Caudovirales phage]|uniref:Uncharacterized protein n=1 Tax=uncultured Caudovirales phage TaxID=2100421 RepID=A0A6J7WAC8_9CAUD|nr:hypothetical protein UFOVP177_5 [uncultured Caudovirales phage]
MADNIQSQWEQQTGRPWSNQSWTSYLNPVNWNVFAQENPMFTGLLGADQSKALSQQSNIAGLLGTAAALAQGMGKQGPRRSAAQNILSALGTGYGASGQAYQQGLQNYVLQQDIMQKQLAQSQLAQKQSAINEVLNSPQVSSDPAMRAWVLSNPDKALEMYVKRRGMQQFLERENQPTQVPAAVSPDMAAYGDKMAAYNEQMAPYTTSGGATQVIPQATPVREPMGQLAPGTVETAPVPEMFTGKFGALPTAPTAPIPAAPKAAPAGHPLDKEIRQADLLSKYWSGEGDDAVKAKEYQAIAKELRTRKTQDELASGVGGSLKNMNPMLQPLVDTLIANAPNMSSAEIQSAAMDIRKKNTDFKVSTETELRKEYSALPEIKEFTTVETAFKQINNALSNPSAANDLAAATKFMKLLDPGSVVRESELGMAMNATGAIDRVQNYFQKLQNGQVLNPEQRADFKKAAQLAFSAAQDTRDRTSSRYVDLANSYNVDANNVVLKGKGTSKPSEKQTIQPRNTKGWQLHTDANGNQAYVSPDGTKFEEVK